LISEANANVPALRAPIQRLDPQPVAHDEQRPLRSVPQREREHAAQVVDERRALFLVHVEQHLAVRVAPHAVAAGLELGPALDHVVDLAVVREHQRAVLVRHRVVAGGRQVDDRKPPLREPDGPFDPHSRIVRTAMRQQVVHAFEQSRSTARPFPK
jgi:hypothetical protein